MVITKLHKLRTAWEQGDKKRALSIAAKFPQLGAERDVILTAHGCITNPNFYKQLGYDIEERIAAGYAALQTKYNLK